MNDLIELASITATLVLVVTPPILIARLIAGPDQATLADLLAFTTELAMPPGVQEEDQPAFRLDRLESRRRPSWRSTKPEPAPITCVPSACVEDRAA